MITKDNFKNVLEYLGFTKNKDIYSKKLPQFDCELKADFKNEILIYPENKGFIVNERQTCNFKANENFVVFECVAKLLAQGYNPSHIELEPKWQVGHGASGGRADILVKDNDNKSLLIIECKTAGSEFSKAWNTTQTKPTQLFSYVQQTRSTKFIALYASDFVDNQVISNYYLINVSDNDELLKNNPKLKSYKEATTVEEIYKVWVDTYGKDFATLGLFEDNKAYDIGKTKFTSNDLKNITSKDIQGKYHEFATILRQHNVSGRENAFDKLVNLFLCKVTDEKENKDELKFYWKGRAYDNPFDFQDRLQQLYKNGMEKFLGETITYIDNNQIDEAFEVFKNKPNATKDKIKEFLKAQKFFTNNDFAFIDVHNEKLFYQNFEVLLKISRLIQDISLTGSDENQFLGDMFEGFLDQGVKQSEGQFFTPMPIVKFIINSLPQKENPKVIDYACGAGHFLNEYAGTNKEAKIIGIEKEYRLSKVAKVSSFMYGSEIDIIYEDALKMSEKVKENSFDVLVANPPYSVKGFLETLSDDDRIRYELLETVEEKSYTVNNAIECFFLERAKQLLSRDAVAGIVVPSSILNKGSQSISTNKGNVYVGTREILLKYFDIVAIAEFGSGTFGKTGTNTVTLFLKRRGENPNLAEHFKNMVECWFECDFETNKAFEDDVLLEQYCSHIEVDFEIYKTLLCQNLDEKIFEKDTFKEYKNEFEKLSDTKNRRKTRSYIALTTEKKDEIEKSELVKYIRLIEKDKFYYFCLAYKNSCDVVIVKSPSDGKENKKFLGYEWSSAKGNEGIHYLTSSIRHSELDSESTDDLDEEDKRILENLAGLKSINTPLYNPQNSDDISKINKIIKDNFEGKKTTIPTELEAFVSRAKLIDMLDFGRVDFNKALSLTPSKKLEIESQYPLVKIDEALKLIRGVTYSKSDQSIESTNKIILTADNITLDGKFVIEKEVYLNSSFEINEEKKLKKDDIFICLSSGSLKHLGKIAFIEKDENYYAGGFMGILRVNNSINSKYAFNILNTEVYKNIFEQYGKGSNINNLSSSLNSIKIPLPPLTIQEEIVKECHKVDDEVLKANETIEQSKINIILAMNSSSEYTPMKLGDACDMKAGKFVSAKDIFDENDGSMYPCFGGNGQRGFTKTFTHDGVYPLIGRQGALCGNITLADGKFHATEHAVAVTPLVDMDIKWLYHQLILLNLNQYATGTAQPGLSVTNVKTVSIKVPPLETQKQIVSKIEVLENKISEAKKVIDGAKEQKEEILKRFLSKA